MRPFRVGFLLDLDLLEVSNASLARPTCRGLRVEILRGRMGLNGLKTKEAGAGSLGWESSGCSKYNAVEGSGEMATGVGEMSTGVDVIMLLSGS